MTKESFLNTIQQTACTWGFAKIAWKAAIEADEKDPHWNSVHDSGAVDLIINSFAKAFGIDIPQPQAHHINYAEKLRRQIAKEKAVEVLPQYAEQNAQHIAELGKKLEKIIADGMDC